MGVKKFEDLECWKEARSLTRAIYSYTKQNGFSNDLNLTRQIIGASILIMSNICKGFDSKSYADVIRYLVRSKRSCSVVKNCLYIAFDQNYISVEEFRSAYKHTEKVRYIIDGLMRYFKEHGKGP